MAHHQVLIDPSQCVGCGLCVKDCVGGNLTLKDGKAVLRRDTCIFCGHCEAICPQKAVTLTGFRDEPEEFDLQPRLDPDLLLRAIKSRRTVRQFTSAPVSQAVLHQILEAGRFAPTGVNAQDIVYVVLDKKKDELEARAADRFRKLLRVGKLFASPLKGMELDDRFFFKGAPLAIVIASKSSVNASIAAENMAFMAEAHGLGVLYSGFFTICANRFGSIRKELTLPKGYKVVTTLVLGYPAVQYRRTARREPPRVKTL